MKVLITGGAGFVGASLARAFRASGATVVAFDNLKRRGSELNLSDFSQRGIRFVHGDIRQSSDLLDLQDHFDLLVEASAEPSVHAGQDGRTRYLLDTNLQGTLNALDFARGHCGAMLFLSTSRVYSIEALKAIHLSESESRFVVAPEQNQPGISSAGIDENFATVGRGFRSLYGATKLASEIFIEEYAASFDFPLLINRCGVIAGRGQFGKTDQGVFTLWVARHFFGGALSYNGFGGRGKQVRDLLHPSDLFRLISVQLEHLSDWKGQVYNAGGGPQGSTSLLEYTRICQEITGRSLEIASQPDTAAVDVAYYVSDNGKAQARFGWCPQIDPRGIVKEIHEWLAAEEPRLRPLFA